MLSQPWLQGSIPGQGTKRIWSKKIKAMTDTASSVALLPGVIGADDERGMCLMF